MTKTKGFGQMTKSEFDELVWEITLATASTARWPRICARELEGLQGALTRLRMECDEEGIKLSEGDSA